MGADPDFTLILLGFSVEVRAIKLDFETLVLKIRY
jgi:hypothetical protein